MANFKWIENHDITKSKADIICHQVKWLQCCVSSQ